jgi:3,4-dihydroxy 2-butanone 4-phosphate synthase/GTP cyclohydrolase II
MSTGIFLGDVHIGCGKHFDRAGVNMMARNSKRRTTASSVEPRDPDRRAAPQNLPSELPEAISPPFSSIPEALKDLRAGKMVILVDDADRENEGDLVMAAEKVTPEAIAFMAKKASGLICMAMTEERCDYLELPMQADRNTSRFGTAFTVTIEARKGVTTGISAADRAHTVRTAISPRTKPRDLARPGHIFPLRARKGGVLVRTGQTEGSVDLCRMAGLQPAAVICEVMNDDGTMARLSQLELFAAEHQMKIVSIADLIEHRRATERIVEHVADVAMPTQFGSFRLHVYESALTGEHHLALVRGSIRPHKVCRGPVLVRVHSECLTGDAFCSLRCDCGDQLHAAMARIEREGLGVILYMRQEGRGIGLVNKMRAYQIQDKGADTVEANRRLGFRPDLRRYGVGAQILYDLGIRRIRLLTNNPRKIVGLNAFGLEVVERVPLKIPPCAHNVRYLRAKKEKLDHWLEDF